MDQDPNLVIDAGQSGRAGRWVAALAVTLVVALTLAGVGTLIWVFNPTAQNPPTALITTTPPASSGRTVTLTAGGQLGRTFTIKTEQGSANVEVNRVTWTNTGTTTPVGERRYLITEVLLECTEGQFHVDPIFFQVNVSGVAYPASFVPDPTSPIPGSWLETGDRVVGEVGFWIPSGAARLVMVDADLREVIAIDLPLP